MRELPRPWWRASQIDYDREMAFVAIEEDGEEVEIGVAATRSIRTASPCEFAIVVAEDWQHRGLARRLMGVLIEPRNRGLSADDRHLPSNNDVC